jgi:Protein of unknown function (DUF1186)
MIHTCALYLRALWGEMRPYPLIGRLFSRPGEFSFDLAGKAVRQCRPDSRVGGDTSGMRALIENEQAN